MSLAPRPASPGTNVPSRNRSAPLELCMVMLRAKRHGGTSHSPTATRTSYFLIIPGPPTCFPTTTPAEAWEFKLDAPGATGSYTPLTGAGRRVTFDVGDVSTTKVTGTLYAV